MWFQGNSWNYVNIPNTFNIYAEISDMHIYLLIGLFHRVANGGWSLDGT